MADEEKQQHDNYQNMPIGQLLKILLVLLGKYISKFLLFLLKKFIKGVLWTLDRINDGCIALKEFWLSDDTQEKKRKIKAQLRLTAKITREKSAIAWKQTKKYTAIASIWTWNWICKICRLTVKYSIVTAKALYRGSIWTLQTTKDLIIHSKPTFVRLGKAIKQGCIDLAKWTANRWHAFTQGCSNKYKAWKEFRRRTSFKGLLVGMAHAVTNGINSFMDEEQNETDPTAITEDDIIAEQMEERQGKANELGKKFFNGVKDIVEDKD